MSQNQVHPILLGQFFCNHGPSIIVRLLADAGASRIKFQQLRGTVWERARPMMRMIERLGFVLETSD